MSWAALPDHIVFVALEPYRLHGRVENSFSGTIEVGCTGLFPAGIPGCWEADEGAGSVIHMHVSTSRLGAIVDSEPAFRRFPGLTPTIGRDDPVIASLAYAVREEIREGRPGCRLLLDTLFQTLCIHLLRRYSVDSTVGAARPYAMAPHKLSRAKEFIHDNLLEPIGIEEIAQAAGLSPYHFARCFKQAVGIPPYHYVRLKRFQRARQLLETSDAPLCEIAAQCGFASQQHLAEAFRDHLGISPGRYRRDFRARE